MQLCCGFFQTRKWMPLTMLISLENMLRPFLFFELLTQSLITFYWKREEVLPSNNKLNLPSNIAKKLLNNPREWKFNSYF